MVSYKAHIKVSYIELGLAAWPDVIVRPLKQSDVAGPLDSHHKKIMQLI